MSCSNCSAPFELDRTSQTSFRIGPKMEMSKPSRPFAHFSDSSERANVGNPHVLLTFRTRSDCGDQVSDESENGMRKPPKPFAHFSDFRTLTPFGLYNINSPEWGGAGRRRTARGAHAHIVLGTRSLNGALALPAHLTPAHSHLARFLPLPPDCLLTPFPHDISSIEYQELL